MTKGKNLAKFLRWFSAIMTTLLLGAVLTVFSFGDDHNVTLIQIDDAKAGTAVYLGGISSAARVNLKIYAPGSDGVWMERDLDVMPNGVYSLTVYLPEDITGEYRAVAQNEVEMTFRVYEADSDNDSTGTDSSMYAGEKDTFYLDRESSVEGIALYADGIVIHFDHPVYDQGGEPMAPAEEICTLFNLHVTKNEKTYALQWSHKSFELTASEKEDVDYLSVKALAEGFDWSYRYDSDAARVSIGTKETSDWWTYLPTQAESSYVSTSKTRSSRQNYGANFGWGLLAQRASYLETLADIQEKQYQKTRLVSYFEATGTTGFFAIGYHEDEDHADFSKLYDINAWGLAYPSNKPSDYKYLTYVGIHNELNNEKVTKNIATREELGYSEPLFPDGSSALGFDDNSPYPYPLNAKLYEMATTRGVSGKFSPYMSFYPIDQEGGEGLSAVTVGSSILPSYSGKSTGDTVYLLSADMSKDPAAPFWLEHTRVAAKEFMEYGMDGAWFDNMSPWDSFQSVSNCFGEWSEAGFIDWLKENYTAEQLDAYGLGDLDGFNIREEMVRILRSYGAADVSETAGLWGSTKWLDEPVWGLYRVYKQQVGSRYLREMYNTMKEEADKAGKTDGFAVIGNDMPALNHGWVTDEWMDMCGTEINSGWSLTFGSRGICNMPFGKMSIMYHAASEVQSGRYGAIWFYSDADTADKTEYGKLAEAEAFANNMFIKRADNTLTTDRSQKWLNHYLYDKEDIYGIRYTRYDTAIVWSTENQLGNAVPLFIMGSDMNAQYHMQGMWGFATALTELNTPYRILPEWKVNEETLAEVKTLILPSVECMDDDMFRLYLDFARKGGRLVLTGATGLRYGEDGIFQLRETPLFDDVLGMKTADALPKNDLQLRPTTVAQNVSVKTVAYGDGVILWCPQPVGYTYFMNENSIRSNFLPLIRDMVGGTASLFETIDMPDTLKAYLLQSDDGQQIFVDLVNYNINVAADQVEPSGAVAFRVRLPYGMEDAAALVMSPDMKKSQMLDVKIDDGWAEIHLDNVEIYSTVKLAAGDVITEEYRRDNGIDEEESQMTESPQQSSTDTAESDADGKPEDTSSFYTVIVAVAAVFLIAAITVVVVLIKKKRSAR